MGGNTGDVPQQFLVATTAIEESAGKITAQSSLYQTAAWGKEDQPAFLNQALLIVTALTPYKLLLALHRIEKKIGRIRQEKYGPRPIDIDILLYNDSIICTRSLIIPHVQLPNRRFALTPLAEIAPDLLHPQLSTSISTLLRECGDPLPVIKLD